MAIHWNQNDPPPSPNWATIATKGATGAVGPAGPAGPRGPDGQPGDSRASDLYELSLQDFGGEFGTDGIESPPKIIPPGSYLILCSVSLGNNDGDDQDWVLEVKLNGVVLDSAKGRLRGGLSGGVWINTEPGSDTVALVASYSSASDAALTIRGAGYKIFGSYISVRALKVGAIHAV
ncbi:MAG: hypothetical protein ABI442_20055 [Gemmatimonadaceae bacterium]